MKSGLRQGINTDKERLEVTKVEKWNSVRVTFRLPADSAARLHQLASDSPCGLRDIGIVKVEPSEIRSENILNGSPSSGAGTSGSADIAPQTGMQDFARQLPSSASGGQTGAPAKFSSDIDNFVNDIVNANTQNASDPLGYVATATPPIYPHHQHSGQVPPYGTSVDGAVVFSQPQQHSAYYSPPVYGQPSAPQHSAYYSPPVYGQPSAPQQQSHSGPPSQQSQPYAQSPNVMYSPPSAPGRPNVPAYGRSISAAPSSQQQQHGYYFHPPVGQDNGSLCVPPPPNYNSLTSTPSASGPTAITSPGHPDGQQQQSQFEYFPVQQQQQPQQRGPFRTQSSVPAVPSGISSASPLLINLLQSQNSPPTGPSSASSSVGSSASPFAQRHPSYESTYGANTHASHPGMRPQTNGPGSEYFAHHTHLGPGQQPQQQGHMMGEGMYQQRFPGQPPPEAYVQGKPNHYQEQPRVSAMHGADTAMVAPAAKKPKRTRKKKGQTPQPELTPDFSQSPQSQSQQPMQIPFSPPPQSPYQQPPPGNPFGAPPGSQPPGQAYPAEMWDRQQSQYNYAQSQQQHQQPPQLMQGSPIAQIRYAAPPGGFQQRPPAPFDQHQLAMQQNRHPAHPPDHGTPSHVQQPAQFYTHGHETPGSSYQSQQQTSSPTTQQGAAGPASQRRQSTSKRSRQKPKTDGQHFGPGATPSSMMDVNGSVGSPSSMGDAAQLEKETGQLREDMARDETVMSAIAAVISSVAADRYDRNSKQSPSASPSTAATSASAASPLLTPNTPANNAISNAAQQSPFGLVMSQDDQSNGVGSHQPRGKQAASSNGSVNYDSDSVPSSSKLFGDTPAIASMVLATGQDHVPNGNDALSTPTSAAHDPGQFSLTEPSRSHGPASFSQPTSGGSHGKTKMTEHLLSSTAAANITENS